MNARVPVSFWISLVSRYMLMSDTAESYGNSWLYQLTFPQCRRIPFSTPCPAFICRLLDDGHSDWWEVIPHCSFHLHLSDNYPLFLLPSVFPSIRVFSNESALRIRWPKNWSFSFNISPSNEHPGWSPLEWTGWISLQSKGLSRVFSNTTVQKHQFFGAQLSLLSNSHIHTWPLEKPRRTFAGKVMSLLLNMLSRLLITSLPRSKRLLISWLQSPSAVIWEPRKIKSATVSTVSPSICHEVNILSEW